MNRYHRIAVTVFALLAAATLINLAYVLQGYVSLGTYLDHVEPDTAIMAWRFHNGQPLYFEPKHVEHINTAYGPLLYILTALPFLAFDPSIAVSKLASVLSLSSAALIFGYYVWRRFGRTSMSIALILFTCFPLIVAPVSFWVRPEAHMVLLVTIALLSTLAEDKDRTWITAIVIAACAGLAMNLKIHAFIFFVPLVFRYHLNDWLRQWPAMAVVSIVFLLLPFALPNVSLVNYFDGIAGTVGERTIEFGAVMKALKWSPLFLFPGALLFVSAQLGGKPAARADLIYLGAFAVALFLTYYPSSVAGSTWRQMLPFFPIGIDLFLRFLKLQRLDGRTWIIASTIVVLVLSITAVTPERRMLRAYASEAWGADAGADARTLMKLHPDKSLQIGYGDGRQLGYPLTYLRPWLAFAGHSITVSGPSTMERQFANKPFPESKIRWFEACKTDYWLTDPSGKPFALDSFMSVGRAFPKEVERTFKRHYQKIRIFGHYQIWGCKTGPEDPFF